jgi:hypothetical protein
MSKSNNALLATNEIDSLDIGLRGEKRLEDGDSQSQFFPTEQEV